VGRSNAISGCRTRDCRTAGVPVGSAKPMLYGSIQAATLAIRYQPCWQTTTPGMVRRYGRGSLSRDNTAALIAPRIPDVCLTLTSMVDLIRVPARLAEYLSSQSVAATFAVEICATRRARVNITVPLFAWDILKDRTKRGGRSIRPSRTR
jgi:hypothetical protein